MEAGAQKTDSQRRLVQNNKFTKNLSPAIHLNNIGRSKRYFTSQTPWLVPSPKFQTKDFLTKLDGIKIKHKKQKLKIIESAKSISKKMKKMISKNLNSTLYNSKLDKHFDSGLQDSSVEIDNSTLEATSIKMSTKDSR